MRLFRRNPKRVPTRPVSMEDIHAAYAWGLTLDQWDNLTDTDRARRRHNITNAPRGGQA